jgi:hypothetical protein
MEQKWNDKTGNNDEETQEFGLSIIPVGQNKTPFRSWTQYQTIIAPISEWYTHYKNNGTVGIVTGRVSGNLEIIDVDVKNDPTETIMDELIKLIPPNLYDRLIVQTTPHKGYHIIYSCPDVTIEGNQKLALHSNKTVIIETRGEGGYFCTSKVNNKVLQGIFDLENLNVEIPVITPEERDFLLETARSLTRHFPSITDKDTTKNDRPFTYKEPVVNEFNDKYPIVELFEKHGWSVVNEDDEKVYLLRPGSTAAHSGYYYKDSNTFFCFSTSTGFASEKPYNHFQILQVMEGKNDYRATLRLLPDYGFELKDNTEKKKKITAEDIAAYLSEQGVRYDTFIQDLTIGGKVIDEMAYNTLYIDLKKYFDTEIPRTRFEEVIKSNYITTINPIHMFIEANKHRHPSGTFEQWLDCMVLKQKSIDKAVVLHFLKKWYVGLIAQALDGPFPNEYFLALISVGQGIGKTTFLRKYTLPVELHDYIIEHSLNYDDDFKVMMSQSLLIIDDEMDGRNYEQEKSFKSLMSNTPLTTRRKYDRRISTIRRRCSFAGSGNNLMVVKESRNRRIIPLEIERMDFEKLGQMDYIDLFMEAYNLYTGGFRYSHQPEDNHLLETLYETYIQKTDLDHILDELVLRPESDDDVYQISALDMISLMAIHYPYFSKRINAVAIGKLMNDRGYRNIRRGQNKTTFYEISKSSRLVELTRSGDGDILLG